MKLTIEISENHAAVLSRWASVGRTLDNAERMAQLVQEISDVPADQDDAQMLIDELAELKVPLDSLHQAIRSQIWQAKKPSD